MDTATDAVWTARATEKLARAAFYAGTMSQAEWNATKRAVEAAKVATRAPMAFVAPRKGVYTGPKCCALAVVRPAGGGCTCMAVTDCSAHGERHHGTHS